MEEPPVKLLIRKGGAGNYEWREEREWPLARTKWTKFYLEKEALVLEAPNKAASVEYSASGMTKAGVASASWTSTVPPGALPQLGGSFEGEPLKQATEITGPVGLGLWAASTTEDMDGCAPIRNIHPD